MQDSKRAALHCRSNNRFPPKIERREEEKHTKKKNVSNLLLPLSSVLLQPWTCQSVSSADYC